MKRVISILFAGAFLTGCASTESLRAQAENYCYKKFIDDAYDQCVELVLQNMQQQQDAALGALLMGLAVGAAASGGGGYNYDGYSQCFVSDPITGTVTCYNYR